MLKKERFIKNLILVSVTLGILMFPITSAGLIYDGGDANNDGSLDITDAVNLLQWLFQGGKQIECLRCVDNNGDGRVDIADAIYLLNFLFNGGTEPVHKEVSDGIKDKVAPSPEDIALENVKVPEGVVLSGAIYCYSRERLKSNEIVGDGRFYQPIKDFIIVNDNPSCNVPVLYPGNRKGRESLFLYGGCVDNKDERKVIVYRSGVRCQDALSSISLIPSVNLKEPFVEKSDFFYYFLVSDSLEYFEGTNKKDFIDFVAVAGLKITPPPLNRQSLIFLQSGDDRFRISGFTRRIILFGGDGNDDITIDTGEVIADGGNGDDEIKVYSTERAIIIGGGGSDNFNGGGGDDILIQGKTVEQFYSVIFGGAGSDIIFGWDEHYEKLYGDYAHYWNQGDMSRYDNDIILADTDFDINLQDITKKNEIQDCPYSHSAECYNFKGIVNDIRSEVRSYEPYRRLLLGQVVEGVGADDYIEGGGGNDIIDAGGGNDKVFGFYDSLKLWDRDVVDNDIILLGAGDDEAYGQYSNDIVYGGSGDDILRGDREEFSKDNSKDESNYRDVVCGGFGRDLVYGDTPGLEKGASDFLIAGLRPSLAEEPEPQRSEEINEREYLEERDAWHDRVLKNLDVVCDASSKVVEPEGFLTCVDGYGSKDEDWYLLNGYLYNPSFLASVPYPDINDFDGRAPLSFDEAYDIAMERVEREFDTTLEDFPEGELLPEEIQQRLDMILARILWDGVRYCWNNWGAHPVTGEIRGTSTEGEKCMLKSPVGQVWREIEATGLIGFPVIEIQGDRFENIYLPDCGIYGPSGTGLMWGGLDLCEKEIHTCCYCSENCGEPKPGPRCIPQADFVCQTIGKDEAETGEIPATWVEDATTYKCNELIWKK